MLREETFASECAELKFASTIPQLCAPPSLEVFKLPHLEI